MMIDGHILAQAIRSGDWKAWIESEPAAVEDLIIGTNSVDLTLGSKLLKQAHGGVVDPVDDPDSLKWIDVHPNANGKFLLLPGDFCLGYARERFEAHEPLWIEHESGTVQNLSGEYVVIKPVNLKMHFVPVMDGRSTMARLGVAVHITAGFGDYGFDSNFTMEIHNVSHRPILLTPGMRVAQLHFESVTPGVSKLFYKGAYAGKNGGPHAPVLGRARFFKH